MLIKVGALMRESWAIYKNNFSLFLKITAWLLIPVVILSFLPYLISNSVIFLATNFFLSLLSWVFSVFISIALVLTISALSKKESVDLRSIYNLSYSKTFWGVIVSILVTLAVGFGTLLLIIPGIIFSVWFSFSLYVFVLENKKGTDALARSHQLVKGRFWPVLWRWIAPNFVYGIILLIVILIPIYIIDFAVGQPGASFTATPPWWSVLISNIIPVLVTPLLYAVGFILYDALKKEKETTPEKTQ
ncbi:glycerophosphoryl diester phosphodiesterase membrane domain-containing protein [Candidatus Falkowbacteria bacterium]|nr:glycerophosphoryl diester phosphodiesterase membrane domain-containing protein [Candidatus Falkowbacteria bacterium]